MSYFTVDELRVASPCSVEWNSMEGDNHARFCGECKKHIYNLSMLTRAEGNELIREKEGKLCVFYYRRFDGSVLTGDCPVGLRKVRKQYVMTRAKMVAAAITLWGLIGGLLGVGESCNQATTLGTPAIHKDSVAAHTPNPVP